MQELWLITGRTPVIWRVPFFVTWINGEARLDKAMHLYQSHAPAVHQLLSLHGRRVGDSWFLSEGQLKHIGEKTLGGNPETYFSWGMIRPVDRRPQDDREPRDEFVEALYAAGIGESVAQLTYFWRQFCLHAAHWMVNKEKPVDMGFVRLHNCPYRANWKVIMTQRFRTLGQTLQHANDQEREYAIKRSGFLNELHSLDLLAMNRRDGTCHRHIEIEHLPRWWKMIGKAEKERFAMKGPIGYADYFIDSIRRFTRPAITIYRGWLAQIARPCVADCESGPDGRIRFVPNLLEGKLSPSSRDYMGLAPVVPNKLPRFKPASRPETLLAPDGLVSEVPDLQSQAQDVRKCTNQGSGPEMDKPGDGTG